MLNNAQIFAKYPQIAGDRQVAIIPGRHCRLVYLDGRLRLDEFYNHDDLFILRTNWYTQHEDKRRIASAPGYPGNLHMYADSPDQLVDGNDTLISSYATLPADRFVPLDRERRNLGICVAHASPYKRLHLIEDVPEIMIQFAYTSPTDPPALLARSCGPARGIRDLTALLNTFQYGAIFSALEGACLANAEYLSCGLPVLSTPSVGGRELWYDENNSVICEPTVQGVRDGAGYILERCMAGEFDRAAIRRSLIECIRPHRERHFEKTTLLLEAIGYAGDAALLAADILDTRHFTRNMGRMNPGIPLGGGNSPR